MSGPHKFITDKFDKDTAVFFSKLSGAAYYTPKSFTHFLRKENIIDDYHYEFLDKNGSQAYILWNSETFIIAFRGTQPKEMQDVFSDMKFWKRPAWEGGKVHTGFPYMLMKFGTTLKEYFLNMERIKKQTKQKKFIQQDTR